MKRQQAKPKITQKMTRDGAVEVNRVTGETVRISARDADVSLTGSVPSSTEKKGRKPAHGKRAAQVAAAAAAHRELDDAADNNVGTEAALRTEQAAEDSGRAVSAGYRRLRQSRVAPAGKAAAGKPVAKPSAKPGTNPASMAAQKKAIKRGYAQALRTGNATGAKGTTLQTAKTAAAKGKEAAEKAVAFARRHLKGIGIALALVGIIALAFSSMSSCGSMIQGSFQSIITSSYTSEDSDIEATDAAYAALESELSAKVSRTESDYPGYDEYRYDLAGIGHDPFELASYLTARYQSYTPGMVRDELRRLFNQQYTLTFSPVTETRYRTEERTGYRDEERTGYRTEERTGYRDEERTGYRYERDPQSGRYVLVEYTYTVSVPYTYTVEVPYTYTVSVPYTYTVQVPYSYHILNVKLTNSSLGAVALSNLTAEQTEMYRIYQQTRGNKPDLFAGNIYVSRGEYTDYDIPPEALTGATFAAMMREAEKYLGWPYVWGGSSPSTSFDCSGYVSWVINHSGWDMGRLGAQGLMDRCAIIPKSEARPGDLIFFQGTYDTAGASHVGIYVGDNTMIHCGAPISYASINTPYWTDHFLAMGRLP
jgi:cell wall-associated NlpC family hydrolase